MIEDFNQQEISENTRPTTGIPCIGYIGYSK